MSLGELLDDLNKDVTNIDTSETSIATENIVITDAKKNGSQFNIQRLSKDTLDRVNNMFNLIVLKQNVSNMPRVDRSVALEVFTMLPDVGKVEQAKLTSAPSIINKEIMDRVFNSNIEHKMSLDVTDKLYDLERLIENHLPMVETLINYFETFNSTVESKAEVFKTNPPLVLEYKAYISENEDNASRNLDLYTEKFTVINRIDDTKVEYPKYAEALVDKYNHIYYGETIKLLYETLIYVPNMAELSLSSFVQVGKSAVESLNRYKEDLTRYLSGLNSVKRQEAELNSETIDFVNGYEDMVLKLETIGKLKAIIETTDNCFEKAAELIEFID